MRLLPATYDACDEAHELVALALDHELSELDRLRLEAHLDACEACRAFRTESEAITAHLRSTELIEPAFRIVLPRSRRMPVRLLQGGAAAVAVGVVALLAASPGVWNQSGSGSSSFEISSHAYMDRGDELVPNRYRSPQKPVGAVRIAL